MQTSFQNPSYSSRNAFKTETSTDSNLSDNRNFKPLPSLHTAQRILFRKRDGAAWVKIVWHPSGALEGVVEKAGQSPQAIALKGLPSQLKPDHEARAKALLENTPFKLTDYTVEFLPGLRGGMDDKKKKAEKILSHKLNTSLSIHYEGQDIEFHIHEVVKIAMDLVEQKLTEVRGNNQNQRPAADDLDLNIDFLCNMFKTQADGTIKLDESIPIPKNFEKIDIASFYSKCLAPKCIKIDSLNDVLRFVAEQTAKKDDANLKEKDKNVGWWFEIGGRVIHIKNTEKYKYYASDYGFLKDIEEGIRVLSMFPWVPPTNLQLMNETFNKTKDATIFTIAVTESSLRKIYQSFEKHAQYLQKIKDIIDPLVRQKDIDKKIKEELQSIISILNNVYRNISLYCIAPIITKLMGIIKSQGECELSNKLKSIVTILKEYNRQTDNLFEFWKLADQLNPMNKVSIHMLSYVMLQLRVKAKQFNFDSSLINQVYEIVTSQKYFLVKKREIEEIYNKLKISAIREDEKIKFDEMLTEIAEAMTSITVCAPLAKLNEDIRTGRQESVLRPINVYGGETGEPYHVFAKKIKEYSESGSSLSSQDLAKEMRAVLNGEPVQNEALDFLPNLVAGWFCSEGARNPSSILTYLMILDLLEEQPAGDVGNQNKLQDWIDVLIHPKNDEPHFKVSNLYGNEPVPVQNIGGKGPMCHDGSVKQAKKSLDNGQSLKCVRQKEGSLILEWLSYRVAQKICKVKMHIHRDSNKIEHNKVIYNEIILTNNRNSSLALDKALEEITKLKNKNNLNSSQKKKLEKFSNEKTRLEAKIKFQKEHIEPLLRERLNTLGLIGPIYMPPAEEITIPGGFRRIGILGDGNCLFRCFAQKILENEYLHADYRNQIINWMRENSATMNDFLQGVLQDAGVNDVEGYINRMAQQSIHGDEPEVRAASQALQRRIVVYRANNPEQAPTVYGEVEGLPDDNTTIHLLYSTCQYEDRKVGHYDLLVRQDP